MEYRKQKGGIAEMESLCNRKIGFYSPQSPKGVLMNGCKPSPGQETSYSQGACRNGTSSGGGMVILPETRNWRQ